MVGGRPDRAARRGGAKPVFPETTIAYCRWHWITLEPEKGKIRWEILDTALEQARLHGQTLAIRLMPYDQQHPVPEWYRNSGARRANAATEAIWEPDFSDPLYLKHWNNLIAARSEERRVGKEGR